MKHSSSRPTPNVFRGFGLCIGAVLACYLALIGFLGIGIKDTLDRGTKDVPVAQAGSDQVETTGSVPVMPVIRANASN